MSSAQHLRQFVNERLADAAEEIFGIFRKAVVEYEEEIERQRRLLNVVWKPDIKLHRIELQQQRVFKEEQEEVLADQQLREQERNSSPDREDPDPPQIKEELCFSHEGEQLELKQEVDAFIFLPACEGSRSSGDQILDSDPAASPAKEEDPDFIASAERFAAPEPGGGERLPLSHDPPENRNRDREESSGKTPATSRPGPDKTGSRGGGNSALSEDACQSGGVFKCDTCGKAFKLRHKLHRHSATHAGEKPHACGTCGKTYHRLSNLKKHLRGHAGDRPYPCGTCGKTFHHMSNLKIHQRSHTGERPYSCSTCGKRFSHLSVLKRHATIHTGEKPYPCGTCQKRFNDPSVLRRHTKIHSGERPYSCDTCGKRFIELSALKSHARVHSGERPYLCNTCGKRFSGVSALKNHMWRIHTSRKPFACRTCGRAFAYSSHLKSHLRAHSEPHQQHALRKEEQEEGEEEEEEEDQQLREQEMNSIPDQEDPDPPQIKDDLCRSREGEQLELKQE